MGQGYRVMYAHNHRPRNNSEGNKPIVKGIVSARTMKQGEHKRENNSEHIDNIIKIYYNNNVTKNSKRIITMSKITLFDTYLFKSIVFYVNKDLSNIEEVQKELRIKDYLYFSIVAVKPVSRVKQVLVRLFYQHTSNIEEVLSCNYRYLVI